MSTDVPDLLKVFKEDVWRACEEGCAKKKSKRYQGDMWWWNEK